MRSIRITTFSKMVTLLPRSGVVGRQKSCFLAGKHAVPNAIRCATIGRVITNREQTPLLCAHE